MKGFVRYWKVELRDVGLVEVDEGRGMRWMDGWLILVDFTREE